MQLSALSTLGTCCVATLASDPAQAATYYVATTGSDNDPGTETAPLSPAEPADHLAAAATRTKAPWAARLANRQQA
jgi:hypothetical protein